MRLHTPYNVRCQAYQCRPHDSKYKYKSGAGGGIRTPDGLAPSPYKSVPINRYGTPANFIKGFKYV